MPETRGKSTLLLPMDVEWRFNHEVRVLLEGDGWMYLGMAEEKKAADLAKALRQLVAVLDVETKVTPVLEAASMVLGGQPIEVVRWHVEDAEQVEASNRVKGVTFEEWPVGRVWVWRNPDLKG